MTCHADLGAAAATTAETAASATTAVTPVPNHTLSDEVLDAALCRPSATDTMLGIRDLYVEGLETRLNVSKKKKRNHKLKVFILSHFIL